MEPLEGLLPHLSSRVVDTGKGRKGGLFARLDNDLYLRVLILPAADAVDVFRLQFYLFLNPDGSHATPPFEILDDLLVVHLGYSVTFPGEFWGERGVRAELRRLRDLSGWRDVSLVLMRVKRPRRELVSAPRAWAALGIRAAGWRHGELVHTDWGTLSRQVLASVDQIAHLLEMVRPRKAAPALHPH